MLCVCHTTLTQKLFSLHVFRQDGPQQRIDCLALRWEITLSIFTKDTTTRYHIESRNKVSYFQPRVETKFRIFNRESKQGFVFSIKSRNKVSHFQSRVETRFRKVSHFQSRIETRFRIFNRESKQGFAFSLLGGRSTN